MINCKICDFGVKDYRALAIHLYFSHKPITQLDYYEMYVGPHPVCECGNQLPFINLTKGHKNNCSRTCAIKKQWMSFERKENQRKRLLNNTMSRGRPKGSKNRLPYIISDNELRRRINIFQKIQYVVSDDYILERHVYDSINNVFHIKGNYDKEVEIYTRTIQANKSQEV